MGWLRSMTVRCIRDWLSVKTNIALTTLLFSSICPQMCKKPNVEITASSERRTSRKWCTATKMMQKCLLPTSPTPKSSLWFITSQWTIKEWQTFSWTFTSMTRSRGLSCLRVTKMTSGSQVNRSCREHTSGYFCSLKSTPPKSSWVLLIRVFPEMSRSKLLLSRWSIPILWSPVSSLAL